MIKDALDRGGIVDITTTGRTTGLPRRIEIYLHQLDGVYYLTGGRDSSATGWPTSSPTRQFTVHLKRDVVADVAVVGEPEPDDAERGRILFRALTENWGRDPDETRADLDRWIHQAPFIRLRPVPDES